MKTRLVLAHSYLAAGLHDEAIALCREILDKGAESTQVHHLAAMALDRAGRRDEAIGHLEKLVALDPAFPNGWTILGRMLTSLNLPDRAERAYRAACEHLPDDLIGPLALVGLLIAQARAEESVPFIERAAGLAADNADVLAMLGLAMLNAGRLERARALAGQALALRPGHAAATDVIRSSIVRPLFGLDNLLNEQVKKAGEDLFFFD
ncbi:MAG: tetratricopeptide repeat protein [Alphaproteobacteria bacterium]|nr:tetratricopeptide repeat protein [Alphaproteobacteria bacterium]